MKLPLGLTLQKIKGAKGFTLVELLVVISILSILLAIVLIAINPARQVTQARDTQRRSDVLAILNAINQYFADNGVLPPSLVSDCPTKDDVGTGGGDLAADVAPTYIADLPKDPNGGTAADTKYNMCKTAANRVTVDSDENTAITVTR